MFENRDCGRPIMVAILAGAPGREPDLRDVPGHGGRSPREGRYSISRPSYAGCGFAATTTNRTPSGPAETTRVAAGDTRR